MIDIKNLRDSIDEVEHSLARRGYTLNKDKFIDLDGQRKSLQVEVETLQSERKNLSNDFAKLKSSGSNTDELKKKIDALNENLKTKNESLNAALESIHNILLDIPNIPHETTPDGKNENDNIGWFLDRPDKSSIFSKYFSSLLNIKRQAKNAKFINK